MDDAHAVLAFVCKKNEEERVKERTLKMVEVVIWVVGDDTFKPLAVSHSVFYL